MKEHKLGFLVRLSVIIIFHLIFKQGDQTFSGAFEPGLRSLVFSLYFITYWMLFWEACRFIFKKLVSQVKEKKSWYRKLSMVTLLLFLLVIICSVIFSWGYAAMDHYFGITSGNDVPLINPEIFNLPGFLTFHNLNPELLLGFILFFFLVYGTHLFIASIKNAKELELVTSEQKKENIAAQYAALKNQIDPHFFFNSLSVLSSLIYESTELSAEYISHMARHYRYILETNNDSLADMNRELDCLNSYFFLLNTRYPDCIFLKIDLTDQSRSKCRILPYSLLMLVENAVKHNTFTKDNPLVIEILEDTKYICIRNNINKRKSTPESTGIGLQNIRRRYTLESNEDVLIEEYGDYFVVKLPKIYH